VRIEVRDLLIMLACYEQYFLTLIQIGILFFSDCKDFYDVPLRRINKLMKAGYLEGVKTRIGEETLYVVTQKGLLLLKERGLLKGLLHTLKGKVPQYYKHDLWVTNARVIFTKLLGFDKWTSERVLKREANKRKVPDGLVSNGETTYVIEVELSLKAQRRYYEKTFLDFDRHYPKATAILYLVEDQGMLNWFLKTAKGWPRIYFAVIESPLDIVHGLFFVNCENKTIELPRVQLGGKIIFNPDDPNRDMMIEDYWDERQAELSE